VFLAALPTEAIHETLKTTKFVDYAGGSDISDAARTATLDVWRLVRGTRPLHKRDLHNAASSLGMALTLEHLRRLGVYRAAPSNPFSHWKMRWALTRLRVA
jgi:hypothetical protein